MHACIAMQCKAKNITDLRYSMLVLLSVLNRVYMGEPGNGIYISIVFVQLSENPFKKTEYS